MANEEDSRNAKLDRELKEIKHQQNLAEVAHEKKLLAAQLQVLKDLDEAAKRQTEIRAAEKDRDEKRLEEIRSPTSTAQSFSPSTVTPERKASLTSTRESADIMGGGSLSPTPISTSFLRREAEPMRTEEDNSKRVPTSTIVKMLEKELIVKKLSSYHVKDCFDWVAQITEYFQHGGRESPLNFMTMPRRLKFESYVHSTYGGAPPEQIYSNMEYNYFGQCAFTRDFILSVVRQRKIDPKFYRKHLGLPESDFLTCRF
jgi:hypothetical protein